MSQLLSRSPDSGFLSWSCAFLRFFLAVSRPDSSNCHERDGVKTDNTSPYTRISALFSVRTLHAITRLARYFSCLKSHFVIGYVFAEHSFNQFSSCVLFTYYLTDATDDLADATDWNQRKPLCSFARGCSAWLSGRSDPKHTVKNISSDSKVGSASTRSRSNWSCMFLPHASHLPALNRTNQPYHRANSDRAPGSRNLLTCLLKDLT